MKRSSSAEVTAILQAWGSGDATALDRLMPMVYGDLCGLAGRYIRGRFPHTLSPTALVHETYLRLRSQNRVRWENPSHFLAIAATLMHRILVDHARRRSARRRGGGCVSVTLDSEVAVELRGREDLLDIRVALKRLAALDKRQARLVRLRFFGGLSVEEAAAAVGVSASTVKREWVTARAFLAREILKTRAPHGPRPDRDALALR